jgi:hypothetical protein
MAAFTVQPQIRRAEHPADGSTDDGQGDPPPQDQGAHLPLAGAGSQNRREDG